MSLAAFPCVMPEAQRLMIPTPHDITRPSPSYFTSHLSPSFCHPAFLPLLALSCKWTLRRYSSARRVCTPIRESAVQGGMCNASICACGALLVCHAWRAHPPCVKRVCYACLCVYGRGTWWEGFRACGSSSLPWRTSMLALQPF